MGLYRGGFAIRGKSSSASSDEPDMNTIGTLFQSYSATDWGTYADVDALGNDGSGGFRIVPVPSQVTTSTAVNQSETILISPGRLGSGKIPHMMWTGIDQGSATFIGYPETTGESTPLGTQHYIQFYARMTIGGTGTFVLAGHSQGINVKFIESWWKIRPNRTQFNTRFPIGSNPDPAPAVFECLDTNEVDEDSQQPVGPRPAQVWDGNWHRFTLAICAATISTSFQRLWVDGVKTNDLCQANIGITPPGGIKPWCTTAEVANMTTNDTVVKNLFGSTQTGDTFHDISTNPWTMDIDNYLWRIVTP